MIDRITHVETLVLNASITAKAVLTLYKEYRKDLPEHSFLNSMVRAANRARAAKDPNRALPLPELWWCGNRSQATLKVLVKRIAPHIKGTLEAVLIWESGAIEGLLIRDGKAIRCEADYKLIKPKGWDS